MTDQIPPPTSKHNVQPTTTNNPNNNNNITNSSNGRHNSTSSNNRPRTSTSGHGQSSHGSSSKSKPGQKSSSVATTTSTSTSSNSNVDILNSIDSDFNCKLKFENSLPPIPFEPKLLLIPTDFSKFINYRTTSMEKSYKYPMLTEPHLGIPIELIDPTLYYTPKSKLPIPTEDQTLLRSLSVQEEEEKSLKSVKKPVRPSVTWLRKTEYLSVTEENQLGKKPNTSMRPQGASNQLALIEKPYQEAPGEIIENTFYAIKDENFVHPTNPSLKPVKILPVFPDFDLWANQYTEVSFDADPFEAPPAHLHGEELNIYVKNQQMAREKGTIKGTTGKFVYFISPTMVQVQPSFEDDIENDNNNNNNNNNNDSRQNKKYKIDQNEDGQYQYQMQKVFTSDVAVDKENENYFLLVKDDAVYYNRVKTRLALKRVKSKVDKTFVDKNIGKPEYVTYESRQLNDKEKLERENTMSNLLQEDKIPFSNKRKIDSIN
ncbi:RNA polymerase II-associated factor 1 [Tieghemostelium lacteum]|uniref:RNA polymerase II-associated factor 1 n=1 Tax=Tieghemostelium lacteum TaxID=361077 RepID=A0A152A5K3_TIELA|nr:RNA polymerase II-associated factor 1 [Tieghemostelium lacteum]|eukprot:KYR01513.1 RNA polymerase II-associated factor 1 [Tieghemostelium lacteum]